MSDYCIFRDRPLKTQRMNLDISIPSACGTAVPEEIFCSMSFKASVSKKLEKLKPKSPAVSKRLEWSKRD